MGGGGRGAVSLKRACERSFELLVLGARSPRNDQRYYKVALSDFWEIKDNQVVSGKSMLNVYHVKRILAGANATNVGQAFIKTVLEDELLALQDVDVKRTTIEVANLGTPTDFTSIDSSTLPGSRVGARFANFNAASIQLNRTRTDMKNGQKRFYAGGEADGGEGLWNAAFVAELDDLAAALISNWEQSAAPGVDVCNLVVLKRFCVVEAQDPCLQYRLPDTDAEIDANHYVPINTIVRSNQRSQVSRKVL